MNKNIVIIGGGIAGLATAYELRKQLGPDTRHTLTLLEKESDVGGKIKTIHENGYVIEAGPDSLIASKPWGVNLCKELGLEDELLPCNVENQKTNVFIDGKLIPLPDGFFLTAPLKPWPFLISPILSPKGRLRAMAERFLPPKKSTGDESLASFINRRFGAEMLERLAGPMMSGIYSMDPAALSMQASFPRFMDWERTDGSVIKGLWRAMAQHKPGSRAAFISLKSGMSRLVDRLKEELGPLIQCNTDITSIKRLPDVRYEISTNNGQTITADELILCTGAKTSAELLRHLHPEVTKSLETFSSGSTAVVVMGFDHNILAGHDFIGSGFLAPTHSELSISACTWITNKFNHRAPDGHTLLRCYVRNTDSIQLETTTDEALREAVRSDLKQVMKLDSSPTFTKIFRWHGGNPQYSVGHLDRVQQVEQLVAKAEHLHLCSSAFRGIGIPDCVHQAQILAGRISESLR